MNIAELRRLEAEATPGEWDVSGLTVYDTCMDGVASTHSAADAALIVAMRNALPEMLKALEWQSMDTAPRDGTFINAVARYPNATAGFPRYIAWYFPKNCWCEFSKNDPEPVVPWAWRPRGDWPSEPHGGVDVG